MWEIPRFQMPDGADIVARHGDQIHISVQMPVDDDGFFGRQCPECKFLFRMDAQDYDDLPDDLVLWCVYCGHSQEHSEFMTPQQHERVMGAAQEFGTLYVQQALGDVFAELARSTPSNSPVSFSVSSDPYYPRPLPGIDEERLARIRACARCGVKYAVFGEHRYCPVCGVLPPAAVAFDALQADTTRLDALTAMPAETRSVLREQGVFTRSWVDTIENVVGTVEALASALFDATVSDAQARRKGKGNVFQRLDDTAELFTAAGYPDLRALLDAPTWQRLTATWAIRHLFTHNDGIVDQKYLDKTPDSRARIGQRLIITEADCRRAVADATVLCQALVDLT